MVKDFFFKKNLLNLIKKNSMIIINIIFKHIHIYLNPVKVIYLNQKKMDINIINQIILLIL